MEDLTKMKKFLVTVITLLVVVDLGFLAYNFSSTINNLFGFATVYDAFGQRAKDQSWITSTNSYAWNENTGWIDFAPANGEIYVADNALWGYAYGENIGWISLNCGNTDSCGTVNYKVANDGSGVLTGYAWSENTGWIHFDPENGGVTIDTSGDFHGHAYGENIGWISFNSEGGAISYKVSTNWIHQSMRPQCNNGLDDDSDTFIDYPDDTNCLSLTDNNENTHAPSGVTTLSATSSSVCDQGTVLTWSATSSTDYYKVYRDSSLIATTSLTTYSDTDTIAGTNYSYFYKAHNEGGDSESSNVVNTQAANLCIPADFLATAKADCNSKQIDLSWSASSNADGYKIFRNEIQVASTSDTSYSNLNLENFTTYTYFVKAYNSVIDSEASATSSVTTARACGHTTSGGSGGGVGGDTEPVTPETSTTTEENIQVTAVVAQITSLPSVNNLVLADKNAVVAARTAYNLLTADQQSLVTNLSVLLADEAKIVSLEAEVLEIATTTPVLPADFCFTKTLSPYTTDTDVLNLQLFLIQQGLFTGTTSNYYGNSTVSSVIGFQELYRDVILTPYGLAVGTGNFGSVTMKKANDILGCRDLSEEIATSTEEVVEEIATSTDIVVEEPIKTEEPIKNEPEITDKNTGDKKVTDTQEGQNNNQGNSQAGGSEFTSPDTKTNTNGISLDKNSITNLVSVVAENIGQGLSAVTENVKQGYEETKVIAKATVKQVDAAVNTPEGSVVTKTVSTAGAVTGATMSASSVLFVNPIAVSEIWLIPTRLLGLLLSGLGLKRKSRPWGTVYDSVTKRPLDPVQVSLVDVATGKEAASAITDLDGRFGFITLPGKYKIVANKTNYSFPSNKMSGLLFDEVYNNLYFGDEITVTQEGEIITKNIPMDSLSFDWNEFAKNKSNRNTFIKEKDVTWAKISKAFFWLGLVVSIIALIFAPAPYNYIITGLYLLIYILNIFGFQMKKSGVLTDQLGIPLSFAIIRIFMDGTEMEMVKKIADKNGRYYCIIPNGTYYIKVDKKNDDGTYTEVYKSGSLDVKKGIINPDLKI